MTTANDPAIQALKQGDEILAALDAMTQQPSEATSPSVESEAASAHQPMEEQLKALDGELKAADDAGRVDDVRRLVQKAKEIVRAEKTFREKGLEDAQDYFDAALKEYGEQGAETIRATTEVANWRKSLEKFDDYIAETDVAYDDVLAGAEEQLKEGKQEPTAPAPQAESVTVPETAEEPLAELTAAVNRLKDLNARIIALSKEVEKKKAIMAAKAKAGL